MIFAACGVVAPRGKNVTYGDRWRSFYFLLILTNWRMIPASARTIMTTSYIVMYRPPFACDAKEASDAIELCFHPSLLGIGWQRPPNFIALPSYESEVENNSTRLRSCIHKRLSKV